MASASEIRTAFLITWEYGLPEDRLLVTVHAGDDEAPGLWKGSMTADYSRRRNRW